MACRFSKQAGIFSLMVAKKQDVAIGRNLARMRQQAGMTQSKLAEGMRGSYGYKWSKATVWSIETGERPLKLTEAQDVLKCLQLDWVTYLPVLLQGGSAVDDFDSKRNMLQQRYSLAQDAVDKLADAYLDFVIASAETFSTSTDKDKREQAHDILFEDGADGLGGFYWSLLKDKLRQRCLENSSTEDQLPWCTDSEVGSAGNDGYSAEWRSLFNLLGDEWSKYIDPDRYYNGDDE